MSKKARYKKKPVEINSVSAAAELHRLREAERLKQLEAEKLARKKGMQARRQSRRTLSRSLSVRPVTLQGGCKPTGLPVTHHASYRDGKRINSDRSPFPFSKYEKATPADLQQEILANVIEPCQGVEETVTNLGKFTNSIAE